MELASLLAGEAFSDHPKSVCPVIAAFLRGYNDALPDDERDELYRYAAMVVGSAGPSKARRERARRLARWARGGQSARGVGLFARAGGWTFIARAAVEVAARIDSARRRREVAELLECLLDVGAPVMVPPKPESAPLARRDSC
jgi:hypothetical protein